jgi:hypothetical protein
VSGKADDRFVAFPDAGKVQGLGRDMRQIRGLAVTRRQGVASIDKAGPQSYLSAGRCGRRYPWRAAWWSVSVQAGAHAARRVRRFINIGHGQYRTWETHGAAGRADLKRNLRCRSSSRDRVSPAARDRVSPAARSVRFIPDKPVAARGRTSPSDDAAGRRRGGEISAAKTPSRCAVFGAGATRRRRHDRSSRMNSQEIRKRFDWRAVLRHPSMRRAI